MSHFPVNLNSVEVIGFDRELLPFLARAYDGGKGFLQEKRWTYLGFIYLMTAYALAAPITKISRVGRIDTDVHGEDMIVEFLLPQPFVDHSPGWGTF
ncbi:hypothetical protein LP414_27410 [Polaromonas sp. P1(28)-13]|nr:hypothetical protein LP414_27410 [Polaromonas sp. P1(28)-13]